MWYLISRCIIATSTALSCRTPAKLLPSACFPPLLQTSDDSLRINMPLIIDIHTHVDPPAYMQMLRARKTVPYCCECTGEKGRNDAISATRA
ncbi:uncharacterized protein BJX67DRAFT_279090 [Aspergillus lucknowensis]|uniref:Amidohydrolase-related domain-containing protein n=1 Tax=Aspergillus lucknowensis TaxID=176173 RepID=A0ABR4M0L8_9EURO